MEERIARNQSAITNFMKSRNITGKYISPLRVHFSCKTPIIGYFSTLNISGTNDKIGFLIKG